MYELVRSSPHFKQYTDFSSPINLLGPDSINPSTTTPAFAGVACRRIRTTTAGTITVKQAASATARTINVSDNETLDISLSEITSVTGVTAILVYW